MFVQTARLTLRNVSASDWPAYQEIWLDFSRSPFSRYDVPHPTSSSEVRDMITRWAQRCSNEHFIVSVCLSDQVIGYIAAHRRADAYEIGYCFHSSFFGRGYAKESLAAMLAYLAELGAKAVIAGTALNNAPSVRLLTALEFQPVGTEKVSFYQDDDGRDIFFDGGLYRKELSRV